MIRLHEAETIPTLLYNAETWTLNTTERKYLDQIEMYAWKKMLGLPTTTPTAGVMFTMGSLFTSIRIDMKQLFFLQKILKRDDSHWTKAVLVALKRENIGWAKQIDNTLEKWDLETDWIKISKKSISQWKNEVRAAAEEMNIDRIKEECQSKVRGESKEKTKTKHIKAILNNPSYTRGLDKYLEKYPSITNARALIMGRYGMLQCSNNYSAKYQGKTCSECNVVDDESHRINQCNKLSQSNLCNSTSKIDYDDIYSEDENKCQNVVQVVMSMWDLENGKNVMRVG